MSVATTSEKGITELKLAPSILSADFAALGDAVAAAEDAGADWIHVDVMDAHFVPNLTFGPKMVEDLRRRTSLPLDVHLMIERPERWTAQYCDAGATFVTVHAEACSDVPSALAKIRAAGVRPGLTINPETPLDDLLAHLPLVDLALVMSVHPGFGGQSFISGSLERVRLLRTAINALGDREIELEVDGGIKVDNARSVAEAGATVLVAGSAVYLDAAGPAAAMRKFREVLVGC